jgi:MFS family permease
MLPLDLFANTQFSAANAVTFVVYGALGATLFLLPIYLQVVGGYSPLESGVALLPLTVIMLVLSARSGRLAHRIGPRLQMSVGPCVVGAGMALLAGSSTPASYAADVLPGVVVLGLGLAATVAPLTATALGSVSDSHSGVASAVNNCVARLGGLIAVAAIPAIAGITRGSYLHPSSFAAGFRNAALVAGGLSVLGGLLAALLIRNPSSPTDGDGRPASHPCVNCALDAAPLVTAVDTGRSPGRS